MKIASVQLQWFYKNKESFQLWKDHNFWIFICFGWHIFWSQWPHWAQKQKLFTQKLQIEIQKRCQFYVCSWIFLAYSEVETTLLVTHHLKSHNISLMHTNSSHPELDLESGSVLMACYAQHLMIHSWQWLKATESKMTVLCVHRILKRWLL